jgi:hypothetical protein
VTIVGNCDVAGAGEQPFTRRTPLLSPGFSGRDHGTSVAKK